NTISTTHNVFTGPSLPERFTNSSKCHDPAKGEEWNAQVWSTLLMKVYQNILPDYDKMMKLSWFTLESINGPSSLQAIAAENLYEIAKLPLFDLSDAQICQLRSLILLHYNCADIDLRPTLNDSDYFIYDSVDDSGDEPYWFGQMWTSPDI